MPICKYCGEEYLRNRDTKRFCSDKCRVYWHRRNSVTDIKKPTPGDSVTVSPKQAKDSVTGNKWDNVLKRYD